MNKKICPICGSKELREVLNRNNMPVHQNYLYKIKKDAREANTGDLSICICEDCGFVFNKTFDINLLNYGSNYDNNQNESLFFREYIDKEIVFLASTLNLKDKNVIEIGCGSGSFLKKMVYETGCKGIGFDPSYTGELKLLDGKVNFIKDYYSERYSDVKADLIICRHVIEHIENPLELLINIGNSLKNSDKPICFFETPSVKWIFENKIFYDFFYEHCSYFDDISLEKVFNESGFNIIDIKYEFSSQYMWILSELDKCRKTLITKKIERLDNLKSLSIEYFNSVKNSVEYWKNKIFSLNNEGRVAVWGAGAKGVTFSNLVDPEAKLIDCLIDININKQGCFIPKTGHEIIDYKSIMKRNIANIIIMNDNYFEEIVKLLEENNIKVNLLLGGI